MPQVQLTDSQTEQLEAFRAEHGHTGEVQLQPGTTLPENYIEAVLLDDNGAAIAPARVLFP